MMERYGFLKELRKSRGMTQTQVGILARMSDRLGIERIGVFGSFARGEETAESDIYIIVSLQEPTLFRYAEIADHLKSVFGREIDLVSLKSHMPETFKRQLEKEAIYVS